MNEAIQTLATVDPWTLPRVHVSDLASLPNSTGLYFAFKSSQLVYIGKTSQGFRARWRRHHRKDITLRSGLYIAYWEISGEDAQIRRLEKEAINLYRPTLNETRVDLSNLDSLADQVRHLKDLRSTISEMLLSLDPQIKLVQTTKPQENVKRSDFECLQAPSYRSLPKKNKAIARAVVELLKSKDPDFINWDQIQIPKASTKRPQCGTLDDISIAKMQAISEKSYEGSMAAAIKAAVADYLDQNWAKHCEDFRAIAAREGITTEECISRAIQGSIKM